MPLFSRYSMRQNRGFLGSDSSALPSQDAQVSRPMRCRIECPSLLPCLPQTSQANEHLLEIGSPTTALRARLERMELSHLGRLRIRLFNRLVSPPTVPMTDIYMLLHPMLSWPTSNALQDITSFPQTSFSLPSHSSTGPMVQNGLDFSSTSLRSLGQSSANYSLATSRIGMVEPASTASNWFL